MVPLYLLKLCHPQNPLKPCRCLRREVSLLES